MTGVNWNSLYFGFYWVRIVFVSEHMWPSTLLSLAWEKCFLIWKHWTKKRRIAWEWAVKSEERKVKENKLWDILRLKSFVPYKNDMFLCVYKQGESKMYFNLKWLTKLYPIFLVNEFQERVFLNIRTYIPLEDRSGPMKKESLLFIFIYRIIFLFQNNV